jgi:hypothetical protein
MDLVRAASVCDEAYSDYQNMIIIAKPIIDGEEVVILSCNSFQ